MKTRYKRTRILSFVLSLLFLLQSCHVYLQTPVSLDEAVAANKRMKVTTTDNKTYKFLDIEKTDSLYYGITITNGKQVKTPLERDKIKSIRPVDKTTSTILTTTTVLISAFSALVALFVVSNPDFYYW